MQGGWYCRSIANEQLVTSDDRNAQNIDSTEEEQQHEMNYDSYNKHDYKEQYKYLKQKLKLLLYENEYFQDTLRTSQRRLLKVSRDRSFLLDRLLQYERLEMSSSESGDTESSNESSNINVKRRKYDFQTENKVNIKKTKKKLAQQKVKLMIPQSGQHGNQSTLQNKTQEQSPMMQEKLQQHLASKEFINELLSNKGQVASNEIFSNDQSLDSNFNHQVDENSPNAIGDEYVGNNFDIKSELIL